jgi:predicted MPP superfamily phosphohydrolase
LSRRHLFKRLAAFSILPIGAGYYAHDIEPFWIRFLDVPIRLASLPAAFAGFRIAQLTDLHTGRVPLAYLQKTIDQVKQARPDLVVVTGDLVHHRNDMVEPATKLLSGFECPVLVSFGNHDFAPYRGDDEPSSPNLHRELQNALIAAGLHVLRNRAMPIERQGQQLWFVGLDDLWFGDFNPPLAFASVPAGATVIALSHNPDTAYLLADQHPDLILSGHTHGGQIRLPYYGPPRMNVKHTELDLGHFALPHSQLYISSGVGYIKRIRFNCRPEVPTFVLTGRA